MAANVTIKCPQCEYRGGVRLLGGDEDEIGLARNELNEEHPNHNNTKWKYIEERLKEDKPSSNN
jgi:hypothetical protein